MERLIKENLVYILGAVILIGACFYGVYTNATKLISTHSELQQKKSELENIQQEYETKKAARQRELQAKKTEKKAQSGKVIYEISGQQFTPEASFGMMFDSLLQNITSNGVRIRSIDYNYQPQDDKILLANAPGYNACELTFITVSNYSQLQNFFKSIAKESYLSNVYEVYIEPYDRNKTILISKFKVRLYTKTI